MLQASLKKDEEPLEEKKKCGVASKPNEVFLSDIQAKIKEYTQEMERVNISNADRRTQKTRINSLKNKMEKRLARNGFKDKIEKQKRKFKILA